MLQLLRRFLLSLKQTNTSVKVFQECLPNSTERVVALGGGESEIVDALKKILEIMQESPIKGNIALYDPSQEWNGGQDSYSGSPMSNMRSGGMLSRGNTRTGMGRTGGRSGFQGGNFNQQGGGFARGVSSTMKTNQEIPNVSPYPCWCSNKHLLCLLFGKK